MSYGIKIRHAEMTPKERKKRLTIAIEELREVGATQFLINQYERQLGEVNKQIREEGERNRRIRKGGRRQ